LKDKKWGGVGFAKVEYTNKYLNMLYLETKLRKYIIFLRKQNVKYKFKSYFYI